jgi:hypothetical protein
LGAGGAGTATEIAHYGFDCSSTDRRLVVLALLKLGLLRKKVRGPTCVCSPTVPPPFLLATSTILCSIDLPANQCTLLCFWHTTHICMQACIQGA